MRLKKALNLLKSFVGDGMDESSYSAYYDRIIEPVLAEYDEKYSGLIMNPRRKELIWSFYKEFNTHCKLQYMKDSTHLIDRHKVVACYMYAVEKARVISSVDSLQSGSDLHLWLNERLAFCFGMSILRALIIAAAQHIVDEAVKQKVVAIFDDGFAFPNCNHGEYKENMFSQFYFAFKENNYNILSLAETLFFIEVYNLVRNGLPEDVLRRHQQT